MVNETNNDYISSLNDGRNVWLDCELVKDISTHPAFSGTINTISSLINSLDDEEIRSTVGFPSPAVNHYVHRAFQIPHSLDDLLQKRAAYTNWSRQTFGVMSRLSDYANSLLTGYYIDRDYFQQFDCGFSKKITAIYEQTRDQRRVVTTAILDPQIDRSKQSDELDDKDALLRVVKETAEGVIVRGAKMIATAAPYAHEVIIMPHQKLNANKTEYNNMFILNLNAPGLQIVCRRSFAETDQARYPLSSRFDEMDAVLLFDDVLIPWERVLIRGSAEGVFQAQQHQQLNQLAHHQTVVRLLTKLEFVAGVATATAQAIGADHHLHVQEKLGELYTQVDTIEALLLAAEGQGQLNDQSVYLPDSVPLQTARNLGTRFYPRAIEVLKLIGAGGFIQVPSAPIGGDHALSPLFNKYYRGTQLGAEAKTALFQLGWELIGSTLGSRHDLYERFYTGDPIRTFAQQYDRYDKSKLKKKLARFQETIKKREELYHESTTPISTTP